jgi:phosphatidylglycerophosphatase A
MKVLPRPILAAQVPMTTDAVGQENPPPQLDQHGRPPAPLWATLVATFFGAGRLRPGPGTWGSLATVIVWVLIAHWLPPAWVLPVNLALAIVAICVGIPAATWVSRASGLKDPQFVVIDETAGQLIALLGAPLHWKSLLAGFILFRVFDIVKPPPIRRLEHLPQGTGIVVDDVAAGLYALAVMQVLLHFGMLGG